MNIEPENGYVDEYFSNPFFVLSLADVIARSPERQEFRNDVNGYMGVFPWLQEGST